MPGVQLGSFVEDFHGYTDVPVGYPGVDDRSIMSRIDQPVVLTCHEPLRSEGVLIGKIELVIADPYRDLVW